mgnify:CR=1 FL=1
MSQTEPAVTRLGSLALHRLVTAAEAAGFWGSIALPPGYVLALVFDPTPVTIAALIGLNVACLVVGHRHQPQVDTAVLASGISTTGREESD